MVAKRVFYRLYGSFNFSTSPFDTEIEQKNQIIYVIKKINNKTLTPKVKHGNV